MAFRLHRRLPDGSLTVDAPIYLLDTSGVYQKASRALSTRATHQEYVWCVLFAVLAHEAAHTGPGTERQALTTEIEQLRRCLFAGHLHSTDGWEAGSYLMKLEAKLRNPREHH